MIIQGKLLSDEQYAQYNEIWAEWIEAAKKVPPLEEYYKQQGITIGEGQLDAPHSPFKALEKKYQPMLRAIINSAPDAPAEV